MKTQIFTPSGDHHASVPDSARAPPPGSGVLLEVSLILPPQVGLGGCVCVCVQLLSLVRLLATHGLQPTRLLCLWDIPGKNTGVGCPFLFQEIFPAQGSNLCLLSPLFWQVGSLPLSHLGSQVGLGAHKQTFNILLTKSVSCGSLPLFPVSTLRARTESDICSSLTLQHY